MITAIVFSAHLRTNKNNILPSVGAVIHCFR
jgi:hypothetical protein